MKHTQDEKELIIAALIAYRGQYIASLSANVSDNDKNIIQSQIDRCNALLSKYGY